jgi:hypothetical protein
MPEQQGGSRAAAWLLAEFDATNVEDITEAYDPESRQWWWPVYVQPMFTLKSLMHPGLGMRVGQADYTDPQRWWL